MSNTILFPKAGADAAAKAALAERLTGLPREEAGWLAGMWLSVLGRDHRTAADALCRLFTLSEREWSLLSALAEAPTDYDLFAVAADWLQENGRDQAGHALRKLRPGPGDLLVVAVTQYVSAEQWAETERGLQSVTGQLGCTALLLGAHVTLEQVTPEEMGKLGWVRVEEAARAVETTTPDPDPPFGNGWRGTLARAAVRVRALVTGWPHDSHEEA